MEHLHQVFYLDDLVLQSMVLLFHDLINRMVALESDEAKSTAPLSIAIRHDHRLHNGAISAKVFLEILICDCRCQASNKDLVDLLCVTSKNMLVELHGFSQSMLFGTGQPIKSFFSIHAHYSICDDDNG